MRHTTTPRRDARSLPRRGVTVIELMVVLIIVAGLFAGGIGLVNSVSRSKLKSQSMRLSGTAKYTYAQAAIQQGYYRLVLDLDSNEYWVEVAPNDRPGAPPQIPATNVIGGPDSQAASRPGKKSFGYDEDDDEGSVFGLQRPRFQQITDDSTIKRRQLTDGIRIIKVFTAQSAEGIDAGRAAITFFPNGFVEPSMIVLGDESTGFMTLELEPLTGKVHIRSGEQEPDQDFFEPEEDR